MVKTYKNLVLHLLIILLSFDYTYSQFQAQANSQNNYINKLYVKSFGEVSNPAIIYLHGGPGYNSANFEITAAENLANEGFFVIIYDRRGEGRSEDANAKYSINESIEDIKSIIDYYKLSKVNVIGHSFGGILSVKFANKYPELVNSIILVGAPVNLQESFKTIIKSSKKIYENTNDQTSLKYIAILEKMDTSTMQYASYCFMNAMKNGFYSTKNPDEDAKKLYSMFNTNQTLKTYSGAMTQYPPSAFAKNDNYTNLDLKNEIKELVARKTKIYGIYGKEDGLYSEQQVMELKSIIGDNNLKYYDNCSHNPFIDRQKSFNSDIKNWIE